MKRHQEAEVKAYQLFIDGEFVEAADTRRFTSLNPFNQQAVAECARGGPVDVVRAVMAARLAFDNGPWPRMPRSERSAYLKAIGDKIKENAKMLTELEVADSGSTIRKAKEDVFLSGRSMQSAAALAVADTSSPLEGVSRPGLSKNLLVREPVGVVAAIIPWNFPLKMAVWKLGPALAAGNTVVLKPSEETPATAMELAQIIRDAGLPKGVVNIITGFGPEAGAEMTKSSLVDKISFTGSTAVGQEIMSTAAGTLKRLTLECGGKSANIVLDDADLSIAVDGTLYAIFYHQGQCCEAGTRLFLPESRAEEFLEALVAKTRRLKIGDPMNPATDFGPLVSRRQQERVLGYIDAGRQQGAELLTGGGIPDDPECRSGFFVEPTIFDRVDNRSMIAQEEIFGPVLSVIRYKDVAEAVRMANDSIYGLAGGVWSSDPEKAMAVASSLRAGTIWINEWHLLNERAPFGGYKRSGIGREFGIEGLLEYTETKHIHIDETGIREKKTWYDNVVPRTWVPSSTPNNTGMTMNDSMQLYAARGGMLNTLILG
ncbi:aldehyde dehydrogenase family protein, partial [bacterium]